MKSLKLDHPAKQGNDSHTSGIMQGKLIGAHPTAPGFALVDFGDGNPVNVRMTDSSVGWAGATVNVQTMPDGKPIVGFLAENTSPAASGESIAFGPTATRILENEQQAKSIESKANSLAESLAGAKDTLDQAQERLDAVAAETPKALQAANKYRDEFNKQLAAQAKQVESLVETSHRAVEQANSAVQSAAQLAGLIESRGKTLISRTQPSGADSREGNIWIKLVSPGVSNTYIYESGQGWVEVDDDGIRQAAQHAIDAQAQAERAEQAARQAKTEAAQAQSSADRAYTHAESANVKSGEAADKAEQAKNTAQVAEGKAKQAQVKANSAQSTANTAQSTAETAKSTAEGASQQAASAVSQAETAQSLASSADESAKTASTAAQGARAVADAAKEKARQAQSAAGVAVSKADTAQSAASSAASKADSATRTAETAKSKAESAKYKAEQAQSTASGAVSKADQAKSTAETAKSTAETAKSTAETAKSTAVTAQSVAGTAISKATAAKSTAEGADSKAQDAKNTAATASRAAQTATATAETAKSTAETAQSTANTAKSKAELAKSAAVTAQSTAETAKSKAEAAKSTAETASQQAGSAMLEAKKAPRTVIVPALSQRDNALSKPYREGDTVIVGDNADNVTSVWIYNNGSWRRQLLTVENLVVNDAMWAKLIQAESGEIKNLIISNQATIRELIVKGKSTLREIISDLIRGKRIEGAQIRGGDYESLTGKVKVNDKGISVSGENDESSVTLKPGEGFSPQPSIAFSITRGQTDYRLFETYAGEVYPVLAIAGRNDVGIFTAADNLHALHPDMPYDVAGIEANYVGVEYGKRHTVTPRYSISGDHVNLRMDSVTVNEWETEVLYKLPYISNVTGGMSRYIRLENLPRTSKTYMWELILVDAVGISVDWAGTSNGVYQFKIKNTGSYTHDVAKAYIRRTLVES